MDARTRGQLRVIRTVVAVLREAEIAAWLFGGWGLDARIGRITRTHGDVEFWVERVHAERSKALLVGAGATALTTQPPEEACEFTLDDHSFSTAYFDRRDSGSFSRPQGRFSDWLFPPGSFGDEPVPLDGTPVLAMSAAGMLAMKEQFPHLRHGRPWRRKDLADMELLRGLVSGPQGSVAGDRTNPVTAATTATLRPLLDAHPYSAWSARSDHVAVSQLITRSPSSRVSDSARCSMLSATTLSNSSSLVPKCMHPVTDFPAGREVGYER
jgi:hypothetical protein